MISPMTICYALKLTHDFARSKYALERTDYNRKTLEELSCAVEEIDAGKFEIKGYERAQWTKFDPNDPKTFPACNYEYFLIAAQKSLEPPTFTVMPELATETLLEEIRNDIIKFKLNVYWRPLPKPPTETEEK